MPRGGVTLPAPPHPRPVPGLPSGPQVTFQSPRPQSRSPSLACVSPGAPARAHPRPPRCGPARAHRAAQGLQVAGQGLQLAPVVVGLVLGLAEQLGVAGGCVVQVGKLGVRGPYAQGRLGPTSREPCGADGSLGTQGDGQDPGLGVQVCPGLWPWLGLFPATVTHGQRAQKAPATSPAPSTVPGQGMKDQMMFATESRIFCTGSSIQEPEPWPPPPWPGGSGEQYPGF